MISPCPWAARAAELVPRLQENAASIDVEGAFPTREFGWMREAGLLHSEIAGLNAAELLPILWHIGRGNLAVGRLYEGHVNALQLVRWFASDAQKRRLFADADAGKLFAVWNTQGEGGVSFEPQENGWQMRGAKTFCSGSGHALRPIVTGRAIQNGREGWQMAVVRSESAQMSIDETWWQPLGMRASASFHTDFSGTTVACDDFLGAPDDYYRQPCFSGGAIRFCAVQLGGAAALFEATRRFLRAAKRDGDLFQQARLGHMAAHVQSGWQWLQSAGALWDSLGTYPHQSGEEAARQMVAFAAMMRLSTEEIAEATLRDAERSVGARGLLRGQPFERMSRDLTMYLKQPHLDEIPGRVGNFALQSEARADELWQYDFDCSGD